MSGIKMREGGKGEAEFQGEGQPCCGEDFPGEDGWVKEGFHKVPREAVAAV